MKTVENKQTEIVLSMKEVPSTVEGGAPIQVPVKAKYGDLILLVINNPGQAGFSIVEIKQRLQIAAAIGEGETFNLEDVDFTLVKTLLAAFKWAQVNKEVVEFSDYIDSIK